MSKIDETLKKIAGDISRGSSQNTSNTDSRLPVRAHDLPGDPGCPICHGIGYLRLDVPLGHPDFGKLEICTCRQRQVSEQVRDHLYTLSNLEELKHMTFENFQPRGRVGEGRMRADSLELACNQAMIFAQKLEGWLVIQGKYGCGKTHLAAAIANFAVNLGVPTLFITVPDLLDMLRFAYDDPEATFQQRFEEIRNSRLLVMDDFGTQNATSWAQEKLFQIVNYRYINRLPTVITTNLLLDQIDERISSRFQDPALVTKVYIQANDYRRPHEDTGMPELSSLDLLHNRTLQNFDLRKQENIAQEELASLEKAFLAARDFAEHPRGWIVFTGSYGVGKTHLAAAIANACR
ncbi:MAG: ATP-binding protein, partial [Omnitrophica WOR_2 bacterium]